MYMLISRIVHVNSRPRNSHKMPIYHLVVIDRLYHSLEKILPIPYAYPVLSVISILSSNPKIWRTSWRQLNHFELVTMTASETDGISEWNFSAFYVYIVAGISQDSRLVYSPIRVSASNWVGYIDIFICFFFIPFILMACVWIRFSELDNRNIKSISTSTSKKMNYNFL